MYHSNTSKHRGGGGFSSGQGPHHKVSTTADGTGPAWPETSPDPDRVTNITNLTEKEFLHLKVIHRHKATSRFNLKNHCSPSRLKESKAIWRRAKCGTFSRYIEAIPQTDTRLEDIDSLGAFGAAKVYQNRVYIYLSAKTTIEDSTETDKISKRNMTTRAMARELQVAESGPSEEGISPPRTPTARPSTAQPSQSAWVQPQTPVARIQGSMSMLDISDGSTRRVTATPWSPAKPSEHPRTGDELIVNNALCLLLDAVIL